MLDSRQRDEFGVAATGARSAGAAAAIAGEPIIAARNWFGVDSPREATLLLIVIITLARLVFADSVGLGEDGAYSAAVARHLSLSYYDHGPMHYWLLGLAEWVTGSTAPLVLRLPFVALSVGSTWLLFRLTALAYGERAGFWATVAFSLAVFYLLLPLYVGPDGPLVFFLLLAAWFAARAMLSGAARPNLLWAAAGLAGGGALLSKYSGVFLFAGIFAFLLTSPDGRRWLLRPGPWLGLLLAALVFSPVVVWNWQHGWVSLLFQGGRALHSDSGGIASVAKGLLGQFGYLAPYFMPFLLAALVRALLAGPRDPRGWLFACLAAPPIVSFTAMDFLHPGLPHWSMPGWLFTFPLLGAATARLSAPALQRTRRAAVATAVVLAVLAAGFVAYVRAGYFDGAVSMVLKPKPHYGNDVLREFLDWRDIEPVLVDRGLLAGEATPLVAGLTWQSTGRIDQVFGNVLPVLCICAIPNHFRFGPGLAGFAGRTVLVIDRPDAFDAHAAFLGRAFERRERLPPIVLRRGGVPTIELRVERGIGFRPGFVAAAWEAMQPGPPASPPP